MTVRSMRFVWHGLNTNYTLVFRRRFLPALGYMTGSNELGMIQ